MILNFIFNFDIEMFIFYEGIVFVCFSCWYKNCFQYNMVFLLYLCMFNKFKRLVICKEINFKLGFKLE